ncbi:unnamed protein product [Blepharisma stoltei]|uniref:Uncharacterized protein n=1 Tax=Blepharisma stoltei TaxID=1481888 RepID=A0AAU9IYX9_9CILI|nr:unnamed protein product [Blepharisma stoltei]
MEKIIKNGWKKYIFFHMWKKSEKSTHKIFNSANFEWKKYKGKKKTEGKSTLTFLYENTNFLNMFTLKWEERINLILLHILILTPPPLNWNKYR